MYSSTCNITNGTIDRTDSGDTRDQFRVDAEWQLGDHLLRFGYDQDDFESIGGRGDRRRLPVALHHGRSETAVAELAATNSIARASSSSSRAPRSR